MMPYRRLTLKSIGFKSGFPRAMSCSCCSASLATFSRSCTRKTRLRQLDRSLEEIHENVTSRSRCSARSFLIFSNSRKSSAVSSSSSSSLYWTPVSYGCWAKNDGQTYLSSLSLVWLLPSESASISLVSSKIRRRFAPGSSISSFSVPSIKRFEDCCRIPSSSLVGTGCPVILARCAASALRRSARRSRKPVSASPP